MHIHFDAVPLMAIVSTSSLQGPSEAKVQCFVGGGRWSDKGLFIDTDDSVNDSGTGIAGTQIIQTGIRNQVDRPKALTRTRSQYGK